MKRNGARVWSLDDQRDKGHISIKETTLIEKFMEKS